MPDWQNVPFTSDGLKAVLADVLKGQQKAPGRAELEILARDLNRVRELFNFATTTANASKPVADEVRTAIETLWCFFQRRQAACLSNASSRPNADTIEKEKRLHQAFGAFVLAMENHDFDLDMDAGLLMPHLDGWRHIASRLASAFDRAMVRTNGKQFGLSNNGPRPRFVAAIIAQITGDTPSVENVGKFLKEHPPIRIGTNEK